MKKERFLKIGITRRTVDARYRGSVYAYSVLHQVDSTIADCFYRESDIKISHKEFNYIPLQKFFPTECFLLTCKDSMLTMIN